MRYINRLFLLTYLLKQLFDDRSLKRCVTLTVSDEIFEVFASFVYERFANACGSSEQPLPLASEVVRSTSSAVCFQVPQSLIAFYRASDDILFVCPSVTFRHQMKTA